MHVTTHIALLLLLLLPLTTRAQTMGKYWVEFKDKDHTPYSIHRPAEFLSARAIERRARAGIAVTAEDLPVDPAYVEALRRAGVRIHHTSRWLNAATVIADRAQADQLGALAFVRKVGYLGRHIPPRNPANRRPKQRTPLAEAPKVGGRATVFGYTGLQNSLLDAHTLYEAGVRGAGKYVAVLDGGFSNVDTLPFFDSLAANHRLFQGWDFVEGDGAVYESASHGTSVLSVMGAHLPGYFIGTAPDATYFLVKTEDTAGEYPVEEANWIAGAEWADSLGADVINASLGYTHFNDTSLNHSYRTLDGRTALGSRGAVIAATKGMIVLNSAGNEGNDPWRHIGVPADAPGLIAVGAVDHDGRRADFSSVGPTADGRIKPDLVAPGDQVVVAGNTGTELGMSSGTSLASPMLAGGIAALWSAYPARTAAEVLDAVFASADQRDAPDNARGYGLPDLARAWLRLGGFIDGDRPNDGRAGLFAFDRTAGTLQLLLLSDVPASDAAFELYDARGQRVSTRPVVATQNRLAVATFSGLEALPAGAYTVVWKGREGAARLLAIVV
jgi:serine protease AprX